MRDLLKRLLAAAVAIPLLWGLLFLPAMAPFCLVVSLFALLALREAFALLRRVGHHPFAPMGYVMAAAIHLAALAEFTGRGDFPAMVIAPVALVALLVVSLLLAMMVRGTEARNVSDAAATLFAVLYVGFLSSFVVRLRGLPEGARWTFLLFLLTWGYDTAAYLWGNALGRAKLWPAVSPRKTWAGLWGGIATATALAFAVRRLTAGSGPSLLPETLSAGSLAWVAPAGCVIAQLGDLAESQFKRAARVKDSGVFLPGHGGVLDKFDAFLFSAPFLYFAALAIL